jgi:hypothetical protein
MGLDPTATALIQSILKPQHPPADKGAHPDGVAGSPNRALHELEQSTMHNTSLEQRSHELGTNITAGGSIESTVVNGLR